MKTEVDQRFDRWLQLQKVRLESLVDRFQNSNEEYQNQKLGSVQSEKPLKKR